MNFSSFEESAKYFLKNTPKENLPEMAHIGIAGVI